MVACLTPVRVAAGAEAAALMGACSLWSLLYAVQMILVDQFWKQLIDNLTFVGIYWRCRLPGSLSHAIPAGDNGFAKGRQWLLAIEPVLVLAAYDQPALVVLHCAEMIQIGAFVYLHLEHGPLFWIHSIYSYSLLLAATFNLLRFWGKSPAIYRRQINILMIGALIPWVMNVAYLVGGTPIPGLDPTPLAFTLTGLALILGVYRFHLLDITPLARSTMIEVMTDGMLVLNNEDRT